MRDLLDENSSSLKSQECKSSNSSLSSTSKNGGRKRKLKESRKKVKERGQRSKRPRQSSSSAEDTLNSPSQETPVKSKLEESPCSVKDILQSKMHHREINQSWGRKEMKDEIMADGTSKPTSILFGQSVSEILIQILIFTPFYLVAMFNI